MAIREEDQQNTPDKPENIHDTHRKGQTLGNHPDPSAKRNVGLGGDLERNSQKDKLENMHIGGDETTGYGADVPDSKESLAQGPGFEYEGSYQEMDGSINGVRSGDQPFGSDEKEPSDNETDRI